MHDSSLLLSLQEVTYLPYVKALIIFIAGLVTASMLSGAVKKVSTKYFPLQQTSLLHKAIYFITLTLFIVAALQQLGFKLSVLLGSAGILTAAIAFASQTSISNIISGAFLIMEKSYKIGDKIKIGNTIGIINSVDLLSVKILTAQNTLIRIPNETLIKSEITNLSKYPTRRLELPLKVSIYEDVETVKKILLSILGQHTSVIQDPSPSVSVQKIDSTGIYLQLSLLANQSDYDSLTNSLYSEILEEFRSQHIQI